MPRPKEFDPDVALERAAEVFRQKGFEAASTDDLLGAMELGRGSLYATFGTKDKLFRAALVKYREQSFDQAISVLRDSETPLKAVREFFESMATYHGQKSTSYGCLIVNSTVELSPHNKDVASELRSSWSKLEGAFADALTRAQAVGEIAADKDPRALAQFCITIFRGLCVDAKLRKSRKIATSVVAVALSALS